MTPTASSTSSEVERFLEREEEALALARTARERVGEAERLVTSLRRARERLAEESRRELDAAAVDLLLSVGLEGFTEASTHEALARGAGAPGRYCRGWDEAFKKLVAASGLYLFPASSSRWGSPGRHMVLSYRFPRELEEERFKKTVAFVEGTFAAAAQLSPTTAYRAWLETDHFSVLSLQKGTQEWELHADKHLVSARQSLGDLLRSNLLLVGCA